MKADYLKKSLFHELEERLLQPDVRKSAKNVMDLYHVRQISCEMSLRMQRSGMKQSQGFGDCFTSFAMTIVQPDMILLADEFIEFGSSGRVFDKQQIINSLQNEPIEPLTQRSITEFQTSVLAAGVVLVTYRVVRHISGEQPVHSLRSSIWKFNNARWKMIFHQGTLVGELQT